MAHNGSIMKTSLAYEEYCVRKSLGALIATADYYTIMAHGKQTGLTEKQAAVIAKRLLKHTHTGAH